MNFSGCSANFYGADCTQTCHCSSECSGSRGCTNIERCLEGYSGPQCQGKLVEIVYHP